MTAHRKKKRPFTRHEVATMRALASEGLTLTQAAERMKRLGPVIRANAIKHAIVFVYGGNARKINRADIPVIVGAYRGGQILETIGQRFGVTRERIRQILAKQGISAKHGGQRVASEKHKVKRQAERDVRFIAERGCSYAQWVYLRQLSADMVAAGADRARTPLGAFSQQKANAGRRGIGWELTLWQWWTIWQKSGRWQQRGRGQGYVMCRDGDTGPYAEDNVSIQSAAFNTGTSCVKKSDLPLGVRRSNTKREQYEAVRQINGKRHRLGRHSTPDLAHAAYLAADMAVLAARKIPASAPAEAGEAA